MILMIIIHFIDFQNSYVFAHPGNSYLAHKETKTLKEFGFSLTKTLSRAVEVGPGPPTG